MMGMKKLSEIKAQLGLLAPSIGKSAKGALPREGKSAKARSNEIIQTLESLLAELQREVKKREVEKRRKPTARRSVKR